MKRSILKTMLCLLAIGAVISACAPAEEPVVQACRMQENELDCVEIGNNILLLSDEGAGLECVWTGTSCVSKGL